VLKELGKADWLRMLNIPESRIPTVLILRGTRNLQSQYEAARGFFTDVLDVGSPNGIIESVLIGNLAGRPIGFACVYGAPMASEIVHIFGSLGTRAVIQTGNCGGLADELNAGDLFVPTEAFCGEGAAQYYKSNGQRVAAFPTPASLESFAGYGIENFQAGRIYTTAALLAEGEADIERWYHQGFSAVDMETATTFAVAEYFGMDRAAVLYVFDNPRRREHILLTDVEKDAKRERANQAARELAFGLALEFDARYRNKETILTARNAH
jgi:uridine phosphorylase